MDIAIEFNNITFSWHDRKLAVNERKHRISLEQAAQAYFDPFARFVDASRHGEHREAYIGRDFNLNLLYVVHLQHSENDILIISARLATSDEEQYYDNQF
jgi:uncharacterized DUF497 family protein